MVSTSHDIGAISSYLVSTWRICFIYLSTLCCLYDGTLLFRHSFEIIKCQNVECY